MAEQVAEKVVETVPEEVVADQVSVQIAEDVVVTEGRSRRVDTLAAGSFFIMAATVVNSGLGALFWLLAARNFSASAVGESTALVSAATLASLVADLGLRSHAIHSLPGVSSTADWSRHVSRSIATAVLSATLVAGAAALILALLGVSFGPNVGDLWIPILVVITLPMTLSLLLDGISTAERRTRSLLERNLVGAASKLIALALLTQVFHLGAEAMVLATAAGFWLIVLMGVAFQLPRLRGAFTWQVGAIQTWHTRSDLRAMLQQHASNLGGQLPAFILPLEVLARTTSQDTAYMSVTFMLGSVFFMISPAVATALFAQGRWDGDALDSLTRRAVKMIALVLIPPAVFLVFVGHWVLGLFGPEYAVHGYGLLILLIISSVPDAITNVQVARWRVLGNPGAGARLNLLMAVIALGSTWFLLPALGINATGWAWILCQSVGCVVIVISRRSTAFRRKVR